MEIVMVIADISEIENWKAVSKIGKFLIRLTM